MEKVKITCWGSRGSCPAPHENRMEYGGNTTCFMIESDSLRLILDGGTGIAALGETLMKQKAGICGDEIMVFLSHLHLDHIAGIPFFKPGYQEGRRIHFYGEGYGNHSLKEKLELIFAPPYWPVGLNQWTAQVDYTSVKAGESLELSSGIKVDTLRANHPDQTVLYRFLIGGKRIVYALDCELDEPMMKHMEIFADHADLLICDAQYSPEEYNAHKGWGHSTWREGAKLAELCHIKHVWFSHFSWESDDEELNRLEREAKTACPVGVYAREGLEIIL